MAVVVDTTKTGDPGVFSTLVVQAGGSLELDQGATFNLYNTADKTTNYEAMRLNWASNIAQIFLRQAGTGVQRALQIGVSTGMAATAPSIGLFVSGATPYASLGWLGAASNFAGPFVGLAYGAYNASSGTQVISTASPTLNQSGTAGATILNVDPTVTATGSGTYLAQRWGWGGTERARLDSNGILYAQAVAAVASTGIGWSSSLGGTIDLRLVRDAANDLALRLGTAAQIFRVYNTYTDGSNYRRWDLSWNTTTAIMRVAGAGTGGNGNLAVGNAALATNATVGYFMIPSSAGAPTGVPADIPTGQVAIHFDSTNNKLYVYDGGWLSTAALT